MAPHGKDNVGQARRKSLNLFSRSSLSNLPHINTNITGAENEDVDKKERKKLGKRTSFFGSGSAPSVDGHQDGSMSPIKSGERSDSPKIRPRTLQKGRPASLFGSLGRKSLNPMDEGESENLHVGTPESPLEDGQLLQPGISGSHGVLYHGEIQTTSGMFRKKKEYLVLTDTHLIRFKSQSRASETFSSIPPSFGRSASTRHPSTTSIGSLQEIQSSTSHTSADGENKIPLRQIVTVYKVEDGRPFFTTEVVYLDEDYHGAGSIQLMLHDPKEADLWHTSIRGAAQKARLLMEEPYPDRIIRYLVSAVEAVDDYDAGHFQIFRVVRRTTALKNGRSSSDDLQKLGTSLSYLAIGINRVHLIPLPDFTDGAGRLLQPKTSRSTYGIVSIVDIRVSYDDDRFELAFRLPTQAADILEFATSSPTDVAIALIRAWQYLKPQWDDYNFNFAGPRRLLQNFENSTLPLKGEEDLGCFDRTLIAYCMAYNCNPINIQYSIDWEAEDCPEFGLWPPVFSKKYTFFELLAVMRALRYNEIFSSISFRDIDLHSMHGVLDPNGTEHVANATRSGISVQKYFNLKPQEKSILHQEVQAIALKSRRLKKLDFTNSLPRRRPKDNFDFEGGEVDRDPGSEIVAAIFPLCLVQATSVDRIILSGIELGETDLDDLIPAFAKAGSAIRAIDFSRCGLNDRGIMQIVTHLERQNATLEYLNISENPGRIHLEQFQASMSRFTKIRKLDLSRTTWTPSSQPLILPEVLLTWHLEELVLNGIPVNEATLESIAHYLACDNSSNLRALHMDQCGLNGENVALLMYAMTKTPGEARNLEFHVSSNRLEKGIGEIVKAMETNHAPSHLFLRMIEFNKEEHFRRLLQALRTNTTIRSLDISKASLPYDAGPDTCEAMRQVFAENKTLEELDISGEQAHLEVTRFGIGLNHALTGLKSNNTLRVLRIEYQNLGLEGANTLSTVLEENKGLTHIFCEHNDINLQGFTILVNALAKNYSLLVLPFMQDDQNLSMRRMNISMRDSRRVANAAKQENMMKGSVRRRLPTFGVMKPAKQELTPQDVDDVVRVLNERWEHEMNRLTAFLQRNNDITAGICGPTGEGLLSEETMRPTTALSDKGLLEQVLSNTTPKVELGNPVEFHVDKMVELDLSAAKDVPPKKENSKVPDGAAELDDSGILPAIPGLGKEKMFELEDESGVFEMES